MNLIIQPETSADSTTVIELQTTKISARNNLNIHNFDHLISTKTENVSEPGKNVKWKTFGPLANGLSANMFALDFNKLSTCYFMFLKFTNSEIDYEKSRENDALVTFVVKWHHQSCERPA